MSSSLTAARAEPPPLRSSPAVRGHVSSPVACRLAYEQSAPSNGSSYWPSYWSVCRSDRLLILPVLRSDRVLYGVRPRHRPDVTRHLRRHALPSDPRRAATYPRPRRPLRGDLIKPNHVVIKASFIRRSSERIAGWFAQRTRTRQEPLVRSRRACTSRADRAYSSERPSSTRRYSGCTARRSCCYD